MLGGWVGGRLPGTPLATPLLWLRNNIIVTSQYSRTKWSITTVILFPYIVLFSYYYFPYLIFFKT